MAPTAFLRDGARALSSIAASCSGSSAVNTMNLKCVFLGAPGSGKGTYSKRVASFFGVPHISAGGSGSRAEGVVLPGWNCVGQRESI